MNYAMKIEELEKRRDDIIMRFRSRREEFDESFEEYKKLRTSGVLKDDTKELYEYRAKLDGMMEELEGYQKERKELNHEITLLIVQENRGLFLKALEGVI